MKRLLSILTLVSICTSCAYPILKDNTLEEDADLTIHGNVKKITSYETHEKKKDDSTKIIIYFDSKGKPLRQLDFYKKFTETTVMTYDENGRLISEKSDMRDNFQSKYEYDEKGNLAIYKQMYDGKITLEKKIFYDKRHNIIMHVFLKKDKPADTTWYSYDYRKRVMTTKFHPGKISTTNFDRKGNIIRTDNQYGTILYEYDKMGRMSKKTAFNAQGKLKFTNIIQNKYDHRNNLISTVVIVDGEPFKKTNIYIDYN